MRSDVRRRVPWKRLLIIYAGLLVAFLVMMTIAYALPQDAILANATVSAEVLSAEGLYPRVLPHAGYTLDNYTDALMVDIAIAEPGLSPLESAVAVMHGESRAEGSDATSPIQSLLDTTAGRRQSASPYSYYWHGYQVFLRPALMLFDYMDIRYLNLLALSILGVAVLVELRRSCGSASAVALVIATVATGYYIVPLSIQYSNMTYLTLAAMFAALLLLRSGKMRHVFVEFFFVVGMLTAFFDLLTTPLSTLCMPLAAILIATSRGRSRYLKAYLGISARAGLAWVGGYLASWAAKWLIASVVLGQNTLEIAYSQIMFRTGLDGQSGSVLDALVANVDMLRPMAVPTAGPLAYVLLVSTIAVFVFLVARYRREGSQMTRVLVPMLLAPLPYAWILLASNHSAIHYVFVYRIQLVVVFVVLYALLSLFDGDRVREDMARVGAVLARRTVGEGDVSEVA